MVYLNKMRTMKKPALISFTLALLLILTIGYYFSNKITSNPILVKASLLKEYPSEWMYNQRAYPNNYINKNAIKEAIQTSKSIIENRAPQEGSDWTLVGPLNTGGRITDAAISPVNDDHLYVSTAVGGVFLVVSPNQAGRDRQR